MPEYELIEIDDEPTTQDFITGLPGKMTTDLANFIYDNYRTCPYCRGQGWFHFRRGQYLHAYEVQDVIFDGYNGDCDGPLIMNLGTDWFRFPGFCIECRGAGLLV